LAVADREGATLVEQRRDDLDPEGDLVTSELVVGRGDSSSRSCWSSLEVRATLSPTSVSSKMSWTLEHDVIAGAVIGDRGGGVVAGVDPLVVAVVGEDAVLADSPVDGAIGDHRL
jgi:hypothetical protein